MRDVKFQKLLTKDEARQILIAEKKEWMDSGTDPDESVGRAIVFPEPQHDVEIFVIEYATTIPDLDSRKTKARGIIAVPKTNDLRSGVFLYTHGTIVSRSDAPSLAFEPDAPLRTGNFESRVVVAQGASVNGYVTLLPDYLGLGASREKYPYFIKRTGQQVVADFYAAAEDWLQRERALQNAALYVGGWSEGGYVALAVLQKLQESGQRVAAAFVAAPGVDIRYSLSQTTFAPTGDEDPFKIVALCYAFAAVQTYHQRPGLLSKYFRRKYVPVIESLYAKDYDAEEELSLIRKVVVCRCGKPKRFRQLLKPEYRSPEVLENSEIAELMVENQVQYYYLRDTRLTMFFGDKDRIVFEKTKSVILNSQLYMNNRDAKVDVREVKLGTHRGTFLTALCDAPRLFSDLA